MWSRWTATAHIFDHLWITRCNFVWLWDGCCFSLKALKLYFDRPLVSNTKHKHMEALHHEKADSYESYEATLNWIIWPLSNTILEDPLVLFVPLSVWVLFIAFDLVVLQLIKYSTYCMKYININITEDVLAAGVVLNQSRLFHAHKKSKLCYLTLAVFIKKSFWGILIHCKKVFVELKKIS